MVLITFTLINQELTGVKVTWLTGVKVTWLTHMMNHSLNIDSCNRYGHVFQFHDSHWWLIPWWLISSWTKIVQFEPEWVSFNILNQIRHFLIFQDIINNKLMIFIFNILFTCSDSITYSDNIYIFRQYLHISLFTHNSPNGRSGFWIGISLFSIGRFEIVFGRF